MGQKKAAVLITLIFTLFFASICLASSNLIGGNQYWYASLGAGDYDDQSDLGHRHICSLGLCEFRNVIDDGYYGGFPIVYNHTLFVIENHSEIISKTLEGTYKTFFDSNLEMQHYYQTVIEGKIQNNGRVIIGISGLNEYFSLTDILVCVRKSIQNDYNNLDLNGSYWTAGLKYEPGTGHACSIGTIHFDGNGNFYIEEKLSEEGEGVNIQENGNGQYNVLSNGVVTVSDNTIEGRIADDRSIIILSDVTDVHKKRIEVMIKKPETNNFTASSLKGKYWQAGCSYEIGHGHVWSLGHIRFDGAGNYSIENKFIQKPYNLIPPDDSEIIRSNYTGTGTYIVDSDGTFHLDSGLIGKISADGTVLIASDTSSLSKWRFGIYTKNITDFNNGAILPLLLE
jgi:hypothetical protein